MAFDAGSVIGAAIGGGLGLVGQRMANKSNIEEAAKNRDWQERMSNTSYQRAMHDMRAAGLNPMLAFMKGGASTPGGGQGAGMENELGTAANSAKDMKRMSDEARRMKAEIAAIQASTAKTENETKILENQAFDAQFQKDAKEAAWGIVTGDTRMKVTKQRTPNEPGDKFGLGGLIRIRKKK
jgi:hypothetical protein